MQTAAIHVVPALVAPAGASASGAAHGSSSSGGSPAFRQYVLPSDPVPYHDARAALAAGVIISPEDALLPLLEAAGVRSEEVAVSVPCARGGSGGACPHAGSLSSSCGSSSSGGHHGHHFPAPSRFPVGALGAWEALVNACSETALQMLPVPAIRVTYYSEAFLPKTVFANDAILDLFGESNAARACGGARLGLVGARTRRTSVVHNRMPLTATCPPPRCRRQGAGAAASPAQRSVLSAHPPRVAAAPHARVRRCHWQEGAAGDLHWRVLPAPAAGQ